MVSNLNFFFGLAVALFPLEFTSSNFLIDLSIDTKKIDFRNDNNKNSNFRKNNNKELDLLQDQRPNDISPQCWQHALKLVKDHTEIQPNDTSLCQDRDLRERMALELTSCLIGRFSGSMYRENCTPEKIHDCLDPHAIQLFLSFELHLQSFCMRITEEVWVQHQQQVANKFLYDTKLASGYVSELIQQQKALDIGFQQQFDRILENAQQNHELHIRQFTESSTKHQERMEQQERESEQHQRRIELVDQQFGLIEQKLAVQYHQFSDSVAKAATTIQPLLTLESFLSWSVLKFSRYTDAFISVLDLLAMLVFWWMATATRQMRSSRRPIWWISFTYFALKITLFSLADEGNIAEGFSKLVTEKGRVLVLFLQLLQYIAGFIGSLMDTSQDREKSIMLDIKYDDVVLMKESLRRAQEREERLLEALARGYSKNTPMIRDWAQMNEREPIDYTPQEETEPFSPHAHKSRRVNSTTPQLAIPRTIYIGKEDHQHSSQMQVSVTNAVCATAPGKDQFKQTSEVEEPLHTRSNSFTQVETECEKENETRVKNLKRKLMHTETSNDDDEIIGKRLKTDHSSYLDCLINLLFNHTER